MTPPGVTPPTILAPLMIEAWALRRGATSATVLRTGMGPRPALRAAAPGPGGVLAVAGFCGGLRSGIRTGDVIVASEVWGPDGVVTLPSAPAVAQALRRVGLTVHVGPIESREKLCRGDRRSEAAQRGAMGVDMESYWLLAGRATAPVRLVAPVDWCVVRAVSDTAGRKVFGGLLPKGWLEAYRSLIRVGAALQTWAAALGPREVLLATPRSFCGGVNNAIRLTEEALAVHGVPVHVLREIVHNRHVVDSFRERGVVFVPEVDDVPEGETIVFSAHGVGQAEREKAVSRRLRVIDATCPLVARVHAKAKLFVEQGLQVVLIGKQGHDEVKGVIGEAPDSIHLVETQEDIEELDLQRGRSIAVLTQTTLIPSQAESLIAGLERRFPGQVVSPTLDVCYASQERQEAVRRAASRCDLMLVVGSPNSSNSKRLVEEATRTGTPAHLVDDESAVDLTWLAGVRTLGLTAGASAPESLLQRMVAFLGTLGSSHVSEQVSGPAKGDPAAADKPG